MDDGGDHESFEARLAAAQGAAQAGTGKRAPPNSTGAARSAVDLAMRLGVELVAAMAIAVTLGWGLDRLFHTHPWIMVGMVPVGMAAGLRNLVRAVRPAGQ